MQLKSHLTGVTVSTVGLRQNSNVLPDKLWFFKFYQNWWAGGRWRGPGDIEYLKLINKWW